MKKDGVHSHTTGGISGSKAYGATSVVLSGMYADEDHGERLYVVNSSPYSFSQRHRCSVYIGSGGKEHNVRL